MQYSSNLSKLEEQPTTHSATQTLYISIFFYTRLKIKRLWVILDNVSHLNKIECHHISQRLIAG
jgi:hypothetical protein